MADTMINDGDIIILRPAKTANNGDMVAVWLEGKQTRHPQVFLFGNRSHPVAPPFPKLYKPVLSITQDQVHVQGKVPHGHPPIHKSLDLPLLSPFNPASPARVIFSSIHPDSEASFKFIPVLSTWVDRVTRFGQSQPRLMMLIQYLQNSHLC